MENVQRFLMRANVRQNSFGYVAESEFGLARAKRKCISSLNCQVRGGEWDISSLEICPHISTPLSFVLALFSGRQSAVMVRWP